MSFLSPLFFLGLLGLALPWLLHRLNEEEAPQRDFPSLRFLEPTKAISSRQKKLRYWLLFALRVLGLLALCLAFAQPVLKLAGMDKQASESITAIIIDRSFSMRHGERWDRAMEQTETVLDALPTGSDIQLFSVHSNLVPAGSETRSKSDVRAQLSLLEPGYGSFDYDHLMRWIDTWAKKQTKVVSVQFITDAQSSAMPPRLNDLIAREIASIEIHSVGLENDANVSVAATTENADDGQFLINATVSHAARVKPEADTVELLLEKSGTIVEQRTVELDASGGGNIRFANLERPKGNRLDNYQVRLLEADELPEDDVELVPITSLNESRVRLIDERLSTRAGDRVELLYLTTALSLDKRNRLEISGLDSTGIQDDVGVVFYLDDSPPLIDENLSQTPELPTALEEYLENGGNVVYILNTPATVKTPGGRAGWVDTRHTLGLNIDEWSDVNLYVQRPLTIQSDQSVLVSSTEDFPLVIESSRDKGRLLWLNTSLNGADNALPISPAFVPFLQSIMDYFLRFDAYPSHLSIGDSVKLKARAQILDPNGAALLDLKDSVGGSSQTFDKPGVYTILDRQTEHRVVVRTKLSESDVTLADSSTLESWRAAVQTAAAGNSESATDEQADGDGGISVDAKEVASIPLFQYLIPLCLVILLLETYFANRHLTVRRAT